MKRRTTRVLMTAAAPMALLAVSGGNAAAAPMDCDTAVFGGGLPEITCSIVADNGFADAVIQAQFADDQPGPKGVIRFGDLNNGFGHADFDPMFQSNITFSVNGSSHRLLNDGVTSAVVNGDTATITYLLDDVLDSNGDPGLQIDVAYRVNATARRSRLVTVVRPQNLTDQPIDLSLISYTDLDLFCPIGCQPDLNPADLNFSFDDEIRVQDDVDDPNVEQLRIRQFDSNEAGDEIITETLFFKDQATNVLPENFAAGPYTLPLGLIDRSRRLQRDDFIVDSQTEFDPETYIPYYGLNGECIPVTETNSNAPVFDPFCDGPDFGYAAEYVETLAPGERLTMRWFHDHFFTPTPGLAGTGPALAVVVNQVPAPTALALLAVGLIGVAAAVRRRAAT